MSSELEIRRVGQGILVRYRGIRYGLDKVKSGLDVDYNLISHAHYDHLPTRARGRIYASRETIGLARIRGMRYYNIVEDLKDVEIFETGHILGSTAFLIEGKILYTGDINNNDRIFLKRFRPPQADILIIEATYGSPEYIFGEFRNQVNTLLRFISRNMVQGRNIVLRAYPLGKPQIISLILKKVKNLYVSRRVARYNKAYSDLLKMEIPNRVFNGNEVDEPFILLAASNEKIDMLDRYEPVEAILSGWTLKFGGGLPISDHADYKGLIEVVDRVSPKKIYTIYGHSKRLASILKEYGYDAIDLREAK